jgi:hypothetical protein
MRTNRLVFAPVTLLIAALLVAHAARADAPSVPSASSVTAPWIVASAPTTADPRDEEFSGPNTIGSTWTFLGSTTTTPIDYYAYFTGPPSSTRYSWNDYRPGWLLLQPPHDSGTYGIYKQVTFASNDLVYVRMTLGGVKCYTAHTAAIYIMPNTPYSTPYIELGVYCGGYSGGGSANTLSLQYGLNGALNSTALIPSTPASGGGNAITGASFGNWYGASTVNLLLHLVGNNTWWLWASTNDGAWVTLGSIYVGATISAGPLYVFLLTSGGDPSAGGAGNAVFGIDYVRFKATATRLP